MSTMLLEMEITISLNSSLTYGGIPCDLPVFRDS